MRRKSDSTWNRWISAEHRGDDDAAEAAVGEVLRTVGRRTPPAELSARLMMAASVQPAAPPRRVSERFVAAGLVALALVMTLLPAVVIGVMFVSGAGRIVSALARVCVWLADLLNAGVSIWSVLARTGEVLGRAVSTPTASVALTITLLVASSAVLALNRYVTEERR